MKTNNNISAPAKARTARFPVRKFLILCIALAVVIYGVAFTFVDMRFKEELARIVAMERIQLGQLGSYVASDVSNSLVQLQALAEDAVVTRAMASPYFQDIQALQSELRTMVLRNPLYRQIRWIDEDGTERVRVVRDGRSVTAANTGRNHDKSNPYDFKSARSLSVGELYISHLDLSGHNDSPEMPAAATLRVATRLQDGYRRGRGILIIDVAMRHATDALRSANEISEVTEYSLLNEEGRWFTAPGQGSRRGSRTSRDAKFAQQHPALWERMSASYAGDARLDDGLWIWDKLEMATAMRQAFTDRSDGGEESPHIDSSAFAPILVAHQPPGALIELRHDIFVMVMLGASLFTGVSLWGLLFLIGGQVREKRADIDIAYATARAEQMERLNEMEKRFRLLVEASGVGMIVINSEGTILMSNSTAESMLGYAKGGLKGLSVDSLLPPEQRTHHARIRGEYLRNPEARKMGAGRKLEALTADGRRIPVEVGLNPYLDHGKQVVLASIIDLSS
ncbi:MAG: PAS domain S-box protein [Gammaproteobacteria bacterium]|jgi:PAS domain S-box-containing protein